MKLPDIHKSKEIIIFAHNEARNFKVPKNFCGGRFQTHHPNIFIHVKKDGKLGKIEISKEGGTKFYLDP